MNDRQITIFLTVFIGWAGLVVGVLALGLDWRLTAVVALWLTSVLAAFAVLQDRPRQAKIAAFLDTPHDGTWYAAMVGPVAGWPRGWRCYEWALRIAMVHPILALMLVWAVTGRPASIGEVNFLPGHDNWLATGAIIGAIGLFAVSFPISEWASSKPKSAIQELLLSLPLVAPLVVLFSAVVFVNALWGGHAALALFCVSAGAAAGAYAVAGATAVAAFSAFLGAVPRGGSDVAAGVFVSATGALAAGVMVALTTALVAARGHGRFAYMLFTCIVATVSVSAMAFAPWSGVEGEVSVLFLFLGLLPLVNAITGYATYLITMARVDLGRRTKGWAILMALADVASALVLFLVLGALLVLVLAGANALAGVPLYPLGPLLDDLRARPENYVWLYIMVFSILVPMLAHLAIAAFSMLALPFFVLVRVPLSDWIKSPDTVTSFATPVVLGTAATVSVLLPVGLGSGLYLAAAAVWPGLAGGYLVVLERLAAALGET